MIFSMNSLKLNKEKLNKAIISMYADMPDIIYWDEILIWYFEVALWLVSALRVDIWLA